MTTEIKVLRENVINKLSSIKDDNVSIAGIAIGRKRLLEALKLQKQPDADKLTINYGELSWHYDYDNHPSGKWDYKPFTLEPKPCIQISCDHTVMRFFDSPKLSRLGIPLEPIPLNFIDYRLDSPDKPELSGTLIDTPALLDSLSFVMHGLATEETRAVLRCVLFESGDNALSLVSADGFRLSVVKIEAQGIPEDKILIYADDAVKLIAFLKSNITGKGKRKAWLDTYYTIADDTVKFSSDNSSVEFNKHDGTYPNYPQLIPQDGTQVEFIASQLYDAVKNVSVIARDGSGIVRLQFTKNEPNDKIQVSATSEDMGDTSVDCDAIVESDCKIAVNHRYLLDLLRLCKDSRMSLKLTQPSSPMVFSLDNKVEVVMPMFVQW